MKTCLESENRGVTSSGFFLFFIVNNNYSAKHRRLLENDSVAIKQVSHINKGGGA